MNSWEIAILKAYDARGGCAYNEKIYDGVGDFIRLTNGHLKATVYGGRPAYVHQVRSHITNLCQSGCLNKIKRGYYCITAKGKKRIA